MLGISPMFTYSISFFQISYILHTSLQPFERIACLILMTLYL